MHYDGVVYWINSFDIAVGLDTGHRLKVIGSSNQKIRQYLACGKLVIAGSGTSQFLEDHGLGILVDQEDRDEFSRAVLAAMRPLTKEGHDRVALARAYAQKHFSIDALLEMRLKHWQEMLP